MIRSLFSMNRPYPCNANHLLIFGRYPLPGRTKTRLIPALGPLGAAECHRWLTEFTVATACKFAQPLSHTHHQDRCSSSSHCSSPEKMVLPRTFAFIRFYYDGGTTEEFKRWLGRGVGCQIITPEIDFQRQIDGDLGQRMRDAISDSFERGAAKVVLVGTDLPDLVPEHFEGAFEALNNHDLVIGPSMDGGYWLVGLKRDVIKINSTDSQINSTDSEINRRQQTNAKEQNSTDWGYAGDRNNSRDQKVSRDHRNKREYQSKTTVDIFDHIEWGTDLVLSQTLSAAERLNLKTYQLELLNDLDTPDDLNAFERTMVKKQGYKETSVGRATSEIAAKPVISVIIPALNEADRIGKAIDSARHPNSEIIVVDGGSRDATISIAKKAGVTNIITGARGRAVQQNLGAEAARGEILLFLHADTLLPPDYAEYIFMTLLDKNKIGGAFLFKTDSINPLLRLVAIGVNMRSQWLNMPYGDQALFFRRSCFKAAGGFPQSPVAEDLLLVRALLMRKTVNRGELAMLPICVTTSARRWHSIGILRTTIINLLILCGIVLGVSPERLAGLYGVKKG